MLLSRTSNLFCKPVFLKLHRTYIPQPRVQSLCIVKRQPVHHRRFGFFAGRKAMTANTSPLHRSPQTLGRRIVPAVTLATHRTPHAIRFECRLKQMPTVLAATIRMHNQSRCRSTSEPGHAQRIHHQLLRHTRLDRPARDLTAEQVQHHRQIQPIFIGRRIRDVRCPDLIGQDLREISFD